MPPRKTTTGGPVQLTRLAEEVAQIHIAGATPLIIHKWSEKALNQMRIAQSGAIKPPREPKNAEENAHAATYWVDVAETIPGIPSVSFKAAMVGACRFFDGLPMTTAKLLFFVDGVVSEAKGDAPARDLLVPIISGPGEMREDTPRNDNGNPDLRYRNQFFPWKAVLNVRFMPAKIAPESVIALADAAGRGGVGEWRPSAPKSATGTYGQFRVITRKEWESA
jgi:hypothetical protein